MKELKYKVGDEVLIKGVVTNILCGDYPYDIAFNKNNKNLVCWSETFNPECVVGEVEDFVKVDDQKTYEQGLNDAWKMAKKICMTINKGGLPSDQLEDIYDGYDLTDDILDNFSAQEAIDLYNAWKERNELKMGDIVEWSNDSYSYKGIFYSKEGNGWWILDSDLIAPQFLYSTEWKLRKLEDAPIDILGVFRDIGKEV